MKLITSPLLEPVSLSEVKAQIGIQSSDTASDGIIARRITEARQWAEDYTRRAFLTQTREVRWDFFPIKMELPSALTIVSVKYIDNDGLLQTVSSSDYTLDTYPDVPFLRAVYGTVWPAARDEENSVRVQFTAGYGATPSMVPAPIREAIILLVGHAMNHQSNNESGITISRVPYAVLDKLAPHTITRYL
jgi:uncharacterized phiE125 gp8 family phage protein